MTPPDRTTAGVQGSGLKRLLYPASVAVVGASENGWNRQILDNVRRGGFDGQVAAVNPRYEEIGGIRCFPSLADVPFTPDAVVVAVAAQRVPEVVEEAAAKGAGGAVVFAGGFAEAGPEGQLLQERVREAAAGRISLLGPNCQGLFNVAAACPLYLDLVPGPVPAGRTALISQSGSVATSLFNNARGVRFSHVVTVGNEALTDTGDVIDALVDQAGTDTFAVFLETLRRPQRFVAACRRARVAGKRVLVLMSGRTEAARAVAASHSGALAPPDRLVDALFRRHAIHRVESIEALIEAIAASEASETPGRALGVVTLSGGMGQLVADAAARTGCRLPELGAQTTARLREISPAGAHVGNPVDAWDPREVESHVRACLEALADDPAVETLVAVVDVTREFPTMDPELTDSVLRAISAASAGKPRVVITPVWGDVDESSRDELAGHGVLLLSGLEPAINAIDLVATPLDRAEPDHAPDPPPIVEGAVELLAASREAGGLSGPPALELLERAGVPVAAWSVAASADDAVAVARGLGFPVVLKLAGPAILHKTEVGGVAVGLSNDDEVRAAAERMLGLDVGQLLVQAQETDGVEVIIGIRAWGTLGQFLVVGLGGVETELLDDVAIAPADVGVAEVHAMFDELRLGALLDGYRGAPTVDRGALADCALRICALARSLGPSVEEIDVNPVFASARGAVAVDALMVPAAPRNQEG